MSYIGNPIISTDFPKDTFSGNGSTTAFTMSIAPASVNSVIVVVSGITQDPSTYTISGTTLTFSAAPPTGTDNISVRHLGIAGIPNVPSDASVTSAKLASGAALANLGSSQLASANLPAGSVLQVVQGTTDTQQSTNSTTFIDITGLSASITPKFTTSKILVRYRVNGSNNSASNMIAFQILRNSTAVGNGAVGVSRVKCHSAVRGQYSDGNPLWTTAGEYLDSPSSTSAITYKIQYKVDGSAGYINQDPSNGDTSNYASPLSEITLMEIAG